MNQQISPSLVRTFVPLLVGFIVTQLAQRGIDIPEGTVEQFVTLAVTALYYAAVRLLETHGSDRWGWLLGLPTKPTYGAPAKPAEDSPTGYEATDEAPVPEGTPVEVEPVPADWSTDPDRSVEIPADGQPYVVESEPYAGKHRPEIVAFGALPATAVKRDRTSIFWLIAVPVAVLYEIVMLRRGHTAGTLSGVSWSFLPQMSPAWWFIGVPFLALCQWLGFHILFRWDGGVLAVMVGASLVVATIGNALT